MATKMDRAALRQRIKQLEGLTDEERSALLELTDSKKYGLVWEDKPENVEERLRTHLPVLEEVEDFRIIGYSDKRIFGQSENSGVRKTDNPNHIIIEGDNLEALNVLSYTHEGRIDVIYIDPPYNTGNKDFVYNDSFVDSEDSYRHSKWLSFMSKRLRIAKRLLSDRGVIFISIDDNEQANLKLLCDEVFGESCFSGDIAWQRTYSPRNDSKGISNEKEHILVYSKTLGWIPKPLPRDEKMDSKYSSPDGDERPWTSSDAFAPSAATHQGMVYAIQHPITGELIYPYKGACWPLLQDSMLEEMSKWGNYEYKDLNDAEQRAAVCGIPASEVREGVRAIVLSEPIEFASAKAMEIYKRGNWPKFYFTSKGKGGIRRKTYKDTVKGKIVTNLWPYEEVGHTDEAKKEIAKIFCGEKPFDTPKPVRLIQRVIQISSERDSILLDFFAGSGTTLHAVMQLNKEDGGKRQCILVTNNENNICEKVTYERNKRVIEGYTTQKGVKVEGLKDNNLRYYRTKLLPRQRTNKNMRDLMAAATDLLCIKENLYNELEIEGLPIKNIKHHVRMFGDDIHKMLIIYNEEAIPRIVDWLKTAPANSQLSTLNSQLIKVYTFSYSNYAYDDSFDEVQDRVQLCALPAAIYEAYRRVLPKEDRYYDNEIIDGEEELA